MQRIGEESGEATGKHGSDIFLICLFLLFFIFSFFLRIEEGKRHKNTGCAVTARKTYSCISHLPFLKSFKLLRVQAEIFFEKFRRKPISARSSAHLRRQRREVGQSDSNKNHNRDEF